MNIARIAALSSLYANLFFLFSNAELLGGCRTKSNDSSDAAEYAEFVLRFIQHLRWTNSLILTDHEPHRWIKEFALKLIPAAIHRTNMHPSNFTHFRSVIFVDSHQNPFDLITKVVQPGKSSLQNWLILTSIKPASIPNVYIPYELNIIFAIPQKTNEIALFRLYSGKFNVLKAIPYGAWQKDTKSLLVKRQPIPLPSLTGKRFRITTIEFPPHFSLDLLQPKNGSEPSGIYGEILQILRDKMNFTYTVQVPEDGTFGNVVNKTLSTGMMQRIKNNESDIIIALDLYGPRLEVIDFSQSVTIVAVDLVYHNREATRWRFLFFLNPFTSSLWMAIAAICVIVSTIFWIIRETNTAQIGATGLEKYQSLTKRKFPRLRSFTWFLQISYYTLLRTGFDFVVHGAASKIVLFTLHTFSLLMYVQYSSVLISVLTVNEKPVPFRSLEDVVYKSDYAVGTIRGTSGVDMFQNAKSDVHKIVWQRLQRDQGRYLTTTFQQGIDLAYGENYAYLMENLVLSIMTEGNCSMHIAEKTVYYSYVAFGYRKRFRYKRIFDKYLQLIAESGVLRKIEKKYSPPHHNRACKSKGWQNGLDERALVGLLVIIACGIIVSLIVLCVEIAIEIVYLRHFYTKTGF